MKSRAVKMHRGFFFTLSIISFMLVLLTAVSLSHQLRIDVTPLLLVEKTSYAWEDVSEGISSAVGINVTKVENTLLVRDELPASLNAPQVLSTYVSFVRRFYNNTDLSMRFYSSSGQEVTDLSCFGKNNCAENTVQFHILPFNITYQYPSWNKDQLKIVCYANGKDGFPLCDFTKTKALNISINLTRLNFTCDPSFYNNCTHSNFQWNNDFDKVFGCSSGSTCINYTLTIYDASSRVYRCSGVYGDNSGNTKRVNCNAATLNWAENEEAVLQVKSSPCQVDLKFGHEGRFNIEATAPSGSSCGINMSTDFSFSFNTSEFYADFLTTMVIRDELANYSISVPVR